VLAKVKANSMFEPLRFDFRDAILFERWLSWSLALDADYSTNDILGLKLNSRCFAGLLPSLETISYLGVGTSETVCLVGLLSSGIMFMWIWGGLSASVVLWSSILLLAKTWFTCFC
jgi:hypothetical protein